MISTSVFEYRKRCSQLLLDAIRRPAMYFRTLEELQAVLSGHAMAYEELGLIDRDQSFERCFVDWLRTNHNAPCSTGWAFAVESLSVDGQAVSDTFAKLIQKFLEEWEGEVRTV